ncbi:MAG: tyrosine-specific transport protein [Sulfurimonas sp.]|jgi:tyrosine-specific transport protein
MTNSKVFGSTLIIAGTTIGAGMLALPLVSSGLGFGVASLVMIAIWALMIYTALLMIEVHQFAPKEATLYTLAYNLLGKKGQVIATGAMVFLFYSLCAAYIAGGGEQLNTRLAMWFGSSIPIQSGAIIFTLVIATVVSISTRSVDIINRSLFVLKLITLAIMLTLLFPNTSMQNLVELPIHQGLIISALPVVFTSFGFHGSIPSIVKYVGTDTKTLRRIFIAGSALPLFIYLLWQIASQGVMPQAQLMQSNGLSSFIASLSNLLHNSKITSAVSIFADLALTTSFLGVSLGLFDFVADMLNKYSTKKQKLPTALVTFLPPLCFAIFYPQGFIMALGYAAFALVILALFLPAAMVHKQRKERLNEGYRVKGGNVGLVVVTLCGVLIMSVQVLQMLHIMPSVG